MVYNNWGLKLTHPGHCLSTGFKSQETEVITRVKAQQGRGFKKVRYIFNKKLLRNVEINTKISQNKAHFVFKTDMAQFAYLQEDENVHWKKHGRDCCRLG
jgi:hypothetical protein